VSGTRTSASTDPGRGGSIYDLGYRGYEGPRQGRRGAVVALLTHSMRTAYGLGRNARSKVMPIGLLVLATLPSLLMVGIFALMVRLGEAGEAIAAIAPITYASLFPMTAVLVFLFCASQAPELFGRDQQSGVLPLYFSRATSRLDYAAARFLGLFFSLLILAIAPQVILFIGRVLVAADPVESFWIELPSMPVMIAVGLITAALVGSASSAIAALTPRRAYATVGIVALFLIPNLAASLLVLELDAGFIGQVATLLSPSDVLDGVNAFLFDTVPENAARKAGLDGWVYLVTAAAWIVGSLAVLGYRYRTVDA
jgi:ABC-2 type transport system permease protein